MKLLHFFKFLLIFLCVGTIQPFIYRASVWDKVETKGQEREVGFPAQRIVVLFDVHNFSMPLNKAQADCFKKIMQPGVDAFFIFEDRFRESEEFKQKKLCNMQNEMIEACIKNKIVMSFPDFRVKRANGLKYCLDACTFAKEEQFEQLNKKLLSLQYTTQVLVKEFLDAYNATLSFLQKLKQEKRLSEKIHMIFEQDCLAIMKKYSKEIEAWQAFDGTVLDYCRRHNCLNSQYLLGALLSFDSRLVDIRMLLMVMVSTQHTVVIYAGGMHGNNIEWYLRQSNEYALVSVEGIHDPSQGFQRPKDLSPYEEMIYAAETSHLVLENGKTLDPVSPKFLESIFNPVDAQNKLNAETGQK